jgi:hypothetical protein
MEDDLTLLDKLNEDMKGALRAQDKTKLSTLRMLLSALKYKEKDLKRKADDGEVLATISSLIKQRNDSVEQFVKGGREDLASNERAEIEVLKAYMPEQLSADEVKAAIEEAVKESGASSMKDMGSVMKAVAAKLKGRADNKTVSELVKERLSRA